VTDEAEAYLARLGFYLNIGVTTNLKVMKTKLEKEILDAMSKNPNNWKGVFYFNRKDPRLIVPKLYPAMGWTFNFSSPYSYVTIICIILIIIASNYFLK
jgi:uncharacterized membrane protein